MATNLQKAIPLQPFNQMSAAAAASTTLLVDADGEEIGIKYHPPTTSPITHVDLYLDISGTVSDTNFRIRVETDNADYPSGTVLGATNNAITAEFAGLAADGFTGAKALAESTGNLTLNVPVWIIFYRSSGGSLSGTDKVAMSGLLSAPPHYPIGRIYTGGAWDATRQQGRWAMIVTHADGTIGGSPVWSTLATPTAATDIYGDYYHAIRFKTGSQITIPAVALYLAKAGTPNPLVIAVFEGDTLKYSQVIPGASIITTSWGTFNFTSPVRLAADTLITIVIGQEGDGATGALGDNGGDDSNDYDSRVTKVGTGYLAVAFPADMAYGYGDWSTGGSVPSGLTWTSTTDMPAIVPLLLDPATDLDQAAGGGVFMPAARQIGV